MKTLMPRMTMTLAALLVTASSLAFDVPTDDLDRWTSLAYNRIEPNDVSVVDNALRIVVDKSASPLVYKLDRPTQITGVTVVAQWSGALNIPVGASQGDKGADDYVLKLGIVEAGERRLNWMQRRMAANWVKQLFQLAPKGSGVERINFLSTTQERAQLDSGRQHPLNDLLHETRVTHLESPGEFEMTHRFDQPVETLGLWVSADGDDTGSSFELTIERITLHTD